MTLDEAITLQTSLKDSDNLKYHPDLREATQLGIEALKAIEEYRAFGPNDLYQKLPGETEE